MTLKKHYGWVVIGFIIVLITGRLLWQHHFEEWEAPRATSGVIDLTDVPLDAKKTYYLDGEWTFYPQMFVEPERIATSDFQTSIDVPGGWHQAGHPTSGYGTYQLTVQLPENDRHMYTLYVPSIRSAARIFVNGQLKYEAGTVSNDVDGHEPYNLPKAIHVWRSDGVDSFQIVVHVSNFTDRRDGGIVRSFQFGTFDAMARHIALSEGLQTITGISLYIVSFLLFAFFIVTYKLQLDWRLFVTGIGIGAAATLMMMSSEAKILHQWIPIDYYLSFRLVLSLTAIVGWALFYVVYATTERQKTLCKIGVLVGLLFIVLPFVSPYSVVSSLSTTYTGYVMLGFVSLFALLFRVKFAEPMNLLLILALISFGNHLLFWLISMTTGLTYPHYPFDLLLTIFLVIIVWFLYYAKVYADMMALNEALQQSENIRKTLVTATTEGLRQPLHTVMNVTYAMQKEETFPPTTAHDLQMIYQLSHQMTVQLQDLLDMSRLKDGTLASLLDIQAVRLQPFLYTAHDMMMLSAERPAVTFRFDSTTDAYVRADEQRLVQVLYNVLLHAYHETTEGVIIVTIRETEEEVIVIVRDEGEGYEEEKFEDFFRTATLPSFLPNERSRPLGLFMSRYLMELQGGAFYLTSEVGKGTQVALHFKKAEAAEAQKPLEETLPVPLESEPFDEYPLVGDPTASILIVDSQPFQAQLLRRIVQNGSYQFYEATTGEEAEQIVATEPIDVLIANDTLTDMSGYTLTQRLRQMYNMTELPILLLTTKYSSEAIREGFEVGANDYVRKPVDAVELRARVYALLTMKQSLELSVEMEGAWLQSQIEPHFFFNTLNTIVAFSQFDEVKMDRLLEAFMNILQSKFKFKNAKEPIPLEEELNIVEAYLTIEQEQHGDRLLVHWDILDDIYDLHILPLTIQPIVENAVNHGLMRRQEGGMLTIRIRKTETYVYVMIEDDGVGMSETEVKALLEGSFQQDRGIGVLNTHLRWKRYYREGLRITSEEGKGTTVVLPIPIDRIS